MYWAYPCGRTKTTREVNEPDTDIVCSLADYYGVTTDYLIGYSDIAVPSVGQTLTLDETNMLELYRFLNAEGQSRVNEYARALALTGSYARKAN